MALIAFLQLINIKWASSWEIAIIMALEIEVNNRGENLSYPHVGSG